MEAIIQPPKLVDVLLILPRHLRLRPFPLPNPRPQSSEKFPYVAPQKKTKGASEIVQMTSRVRVFFFPGTI